jgi:3-phosphoglycerate kinase
MEYFDYKTIHKYKEILGKYGDIYVNDAPNMTLTNSNSIAEIKCKKRVMGHRMTSELRKVAMFFLKPYPYDINKVYYKPPQFMDYYSYKFTAILGAATKSSSDILDKILLANALLDTVSRIYFVGEVALAALYALGITVGKVERTEDNISDYEKMKEFFVKLFEKAADKRVPIILPTDFIVSPKVEFEEETKSEA